MTQTLATGMQFLFDVDLRYQEPTVAMARPDGAGDLIGSGIGQRLDIAPSRSIRRTAMQVR